MRAIAPFIAAVLATSCASTPSPLDWYTDCTQLFDAIEKRTVEAGVEDAGSRRVEDFPWLRSNRFLASFRDDVEGGWAFDAWVERMRQLDLELRAVELANLGVADRDAILSRLAQCGRERSAALSTDDADRAALRRVVVVPDDYSTMKRLFGLYVIAIPFLRSGMESFNAEVVADHARDPSDLAVGGASTAWGPPDADAPDESTVAQWLKDTDALGIPSLDAARWTSLAHRFAPTWWVAQGGPYDQIGAPRMDGDVPTVDASVPVTYWAGTFTRFRGEVLAQLSYTVWFSERPAQGLSDPYAGALDGVVWRVTLDRQGRPLHYDTIHACGCYHFHYSVAGLAPAPAVGQFSEPVLFPQAAVPSGAPTIRLHSATHQVAKVVAAQDVNASERRQYGLAPYADLLRRRVEGGATRSLFGADGIVPGTDRLESHWLWVAGVDDPGAMRQAGRHATSFIGRRHFDDPFLLEQLYSAGP